MKQNFDDEHFHDAFNFHLDYFEFNIWILKKEKCVNKSVK